MLQDTNLRHISSTENAREVVQVVVLVQVSELTFSKPQIGLTFEYEVDRLLASRKRRLEGLEAEEGFGNATERKGMGEGHVGVGG
jgi:hypothetical protein